MYVFMYAHPVYVLCKRKGVWAVQTIFTKCYYARRNVMVCIWYYNPGRTFPTEMTVLTITHNSGKAEHIVCIYTTALGGCNMIIPRRYTLLL